MKLLKIILLSATVISINTFASEEPVNFSSCQQSLKKSIFDAKKMMAEDFSLKKSEFRKITYSEPMNVSHNHFKREFYLEMNSETITVAIGFLLIRDKKTGLKCEFVEVEDYIY